MKPARSDDNANDVSPDVLQKARQVWCSLVISCEGMAGTVVQLAESPNEAWIKLVLHYCASGPKDRCRINCPMLYNKNVAREAPLKLFSDG